VRFHRADLLEKGASSIEYTHSHKQQKRTAMVDEYLCITI
jgi:hypothetical protein